MTYDKYAASGLKQVRKWMIEKFEEKPSITSFYNRRKLSGKCPASVLIINSIMLFLPVKFLKISEQLRLQATKKLDGLENMKEKKHLIYHFYF